MSLNTFKQTISYYMRGRNYSNYICCVGTAKKLKDYKTDDLLELLDDIGMEQYKPIFMEEELDGDTVNEWTVSDIEDVGISSALDQLKIYLAFCQLKPERRDRSNTFSTQYETVIKFLQSKPDFQQYVDIFRKNNITGEILLKATPPVLQEIGVQSCLEASKIIVFFAKYVGHSDYNHEHSVAELVSRLKYLGKDEYIDVVKESGLSVHILQMGGKPILMDLFRIKKIKAETMLKKLLLSK